MIGRNGGADTREWSTLRKSERECFNCHEKGHLRQDCVNEKRVKCFNCEEIGHVQRDCKEPEKDRPRETTVGDGSER